MRKFLKWLTVILAILTCFSFAACGKKESVKTLKDILLTEEEYAFAIAKNDAPLLDEVNELIGEIKADGSLESLINSYFDNTADFTYQNKTNAPTDGDFVVATNANFPPFEYIEGSAFKGIDIEIAHLIAEKLDRTLFIKDMNFEAIIPDIVNNNSDIGMAGMTIKPERLEQVNFADPYYTSAQVITVQKEDATFDACQTAADVEAILQSKGSSYKVGTQNGTTGYYYSVAFENLTTRDYLTGALAMTDLAGGRINAVILDLQPSLMFANGFVAMSNIEIFHEQFFKFGGYENFFKGLANTAIIAVFGLLIGFVIGCVIATVKILPSKNIFVKILQKLCDLYVALFRGTPMVVQLLLMHFAVFPMLGIYIDSVAEAVIIFGFNSGAYMAEILRGGINAVDKGQMEAGRSLGFGFGSTMLRIILPQAIKNILPTLGNEFIALIKETSVVSFIAVMDVTKAFQNIGNATYEYFVPYIVLALTYLVLVLGITKLIKIMEKRLAKNER